MSAARIQRGNAARPRVRTPSKRKAAKPSLLARALGTVPVEPEAIRRVTTWAGLAAAAALLVIAAHLAGLFGFAWQSSAEALGRAGLKVEHVDVRGLKRMDGLTVYAAALDQRTRAMPLVDLSAIRERLLGHGWVADARVSRRLPDTLVIDIVEREPAAVWQHRGRLVLIDKAGVVLAPVSVAAMPDLPLVIGPDANAQAAALDRLVEAAPAIRPMLAAATWVGGRRWDLRFQSGEVLALPEGEQAAVTALVKFVRLDGQERLLGRGFERFDMRDPTRMVVRVDRDGRSIDESEGGDEGAAQVARATT